MTTPASATHTTESDDRQPLDIEAMFPADPDLMVSPEGDERGLAELKSAARDRRRQLNRA